MNLLSGVTSRLGTSYTSIREGVASKIDAAQEIVTEVTYAWQNSDDDDLLMSEAAIGGDNVTPRGPQVGFSGDDEVDKLERIKLEIASLEQSDNPPPTLFFEPMLDSLAPVYHVIQPTRSSKANSCEGTADGVEPGSEVNERRETSSVEFEDSQSMLIVDDVLESYNRENNAVKIDKMRAINRALLEEAESMKLQLTEERCERQRVMTILEEKEGTIQGLTNAQIGLKDELSDADKQIEHWKNASAQFEDSEKIIMENHRQLMIRYYNIPDQKGCNCTNDTQNIGDQLALEKAETEKLSSELEDLQSQLSLSADMMEEQKIMFNQQRQSLTAQINHYKDLEEERTQIQLKNDELSLYIQKSELREAEVSDQMMKLKEDLDKNIKKNLDLEKATVGLLDRVNKVMVQEDVLVNIEDVRHKIEEILAKEEVNSDDPLKPEIIWVLRTLIGNELQFTPWERMRWLGIDKQPPNVKGESGLGAQFLSFLESATDQGK